MIYHFYYHLHLNHRLHPRNHQENEITSLHDMQYSNVEEQLVNPRITRPTIQRDKSREDEEEDEPVTWTLI